MSYVGSQLLTRRKNFTKSQTPSLDETTITQAAFAEFQELWKDPQKKLMATPGKDALGYVNSKLQDSLGINVTPTSIIESMREPEIPGEMVHLILKLKAFSEAPVLGAQF
jgi:hypothetical protein